MLKAPAAVAGLPHWVHADLGRAVPGDRGDHLAILAMVQFRMTSKMTNHEKNGDLMLMHSD